MDHTRGLAIGKGEFLTIALVDELAMVQTEQVQDGGEIVVVMDYVFLGAVAKFVGVAVGDAALDASPAKSMEKPSVL